MASRWNFSTRGLGLPVLTGDSWVAALRRSLQSVLSNLRKVLSLRWAQSGGAWRVQAAPVCERPISTRTAGRVPSGSPGNQRLRSVGEHKVSVTSGCPGALGSEYVPNSATVLPKLTVRAERGCDRAASSALLPLRSALESPRRAQVAFVLRRAAALQADPEQAQPLAISLPPAAITRLLCFQVFF